MQPTLPGVDEASMPSSTGSEVVADPPPPVYAESIDLTPAVEPAAADAPYCYQCGNVMQRAGTCYVCGSCGTTSGCS
jgi:ribonucleoside-diphosphate reductase alpha chain